MLLAVPIFLPKLCSNYAIFPNHATCSQNYSFCRMSETSPINVSRSCSNAFLASQAPLLLYFAGMAQWWEYSPHFDVARSQFRFPDSASYVGWVCWLLCTERVSPGTPVSPLLKNQHLTWFVLLHGAEWLLFVGYILAFWHKLLSSHLNSHVGS